MFCIFAKKLSNYRPIFNILNFLKYRIFKFMKLICKGGFIRD